MYCCFVFQNRQHKQKPSATSRSKGSGVSTHLHKYILGHPATASYKGSNIWCVLHTHLDVVCIHHAFHGPSAINITKPTVDHVEPPETYRDILQTMKSDSFVSFRSN